MTDIPTIASVPGIWPLGFGCVLTSFAIVDGMPLFFMRAVPDAAIGTPGEAADSGTWNACEGCTTLTLAFADLDAVERHIASMKELSGAVREYLKEQER